MTENEKILAVLSDIEAELKELSLWQGESGRPATAALNAPAPFGLGVMEFHEWLEYVLLPRLREMIEDQRELPSSLLTHPMAEEVWRGKWGQYRRLIGHLRRLDSLFA